MEPTYFRLLTAEHVASLLSMPELIDLMEQTLRRFSSGDVVQPVRTVLAAGEEQLFGVMPALIRDPPAMGAKLVTVFGKNAALALPTHLAAICLFSPHTGAL